jgi:hypothetical protein
VTADQRALEVMASSTCLERASVRGRIWGPEAPCSEGGGDLLAVKPVTVRRGPVRWLRGATARIRR